MAEERSLERLLRAVSTSDMSPAMIAVGSQTTITCWSLTGEKREAGISGRLRLTRFRQESGRRAHTPTRLFPAPMRSRPPRHRAALPPKCVQPIAPLAFVSLTPQREWEVFQLR